MIIDQETCIGCGECVFTCTVQAIRLNEDKAEIDRDRCVECGNCLRIAECPTEALQQDELSYPRIWRKYFSDNQQKWPDHVRFSTGFGRGTEECKTNDRTGRFKQGQVGVLVELGLVRLKSWNQGMRIWGLSATMGNIDTALKVLLGNSAHRGCLIRGEQPKSIRVESVIPSQMERFPWAGHLGLNLLPQVLEKIASAESSLIFTNTRSQTEIWFRAILDARPDWEDRFALHHGSLDRSDREAVEHGLQSGRLRGVVCTSSLDLGVDFTPVDLVIQIGSPKGVARLIQRAGRSGHGPGKTSRVICVPTHGLELVEEVVKSGVVKQ